jgi:hypothetical protein
LVRSESVRLCALASSPQKARKSMIIKFFILFIIPNI